MFDKDSADIFYDGQNIKKDGYKVGLFTYTVSKVSNAFVFGMKL